MPHTATVPAIAGTTGNFLSWFNGAHVPPEKAMVSVLSHALHYGTSTFEGLRCYETPKGPAVFRLQDHIKRLFFSAGFLEMKLAYTQKDMCDAVLSTIAANGFRECYVRPLLFYGEGGLGFKLDNNKVHALVATYPMGPFLGKDGLAAGVKIKTVSWRKTPSSSVPSSAKLGGNYVNSMLAYMEARKAGADEAILLRDNGSVAEGAGDNIFIVRNGEILTPSASQDNLPGITRDSVIQIAKSLGLKVHETSLTRANVIEADEVFLCGTAVEVCPVRDVDDRTIGDGKPGPITTRIQQAYYKAVRGELKGFEAWVTRVPG